MDERLSSLAAGAGLLGALGALGGLSFSALLSPALRVLIEQLRGKKTVIESTQPHSI